MTHAVQAGDTLWDIVRDHYGHVDAELAPDGRPRQSTDHRSGSDLRRLADHASRHPLLAPPHVDACDPTVHGEATWAVVTVQPGDTLWDIVDRHYGHATAELVWATVDANPAIDDPDLIYPGQQITLPPEPATSPIRAAAMAPTEPVPPRRHRATATTSGRRPCHRRADRSTRRTRSPSVPRRLPQRIRGRRYRARTSSRPTESRRRLPSPHASCSHRRQLRSDDGRNRPFVRSARRLDRGSGPRRRRCSALPPAAVVDSRCTSAIAGQRERAVELGVALRETDNLLDRRLGSERATVARRAPSPAPWRADAGAEAAAARRRADRTGLGQPEPGSPRPWTTADGGWSWTLRPRTISSTSDRRPEPVSDASSPSADETAPTSCSTSRAAERSPSPATPSRSTALTIRSCSNWRRAHSPTRRPSSSWEGRRSRRPEHARVVEVAEALGWMRDRCRLGQRAARASPTHVAVRAPRPLTSQDGHEPVIVVRRCRRASTTMSCAI